MSTPTDTDLDAELDSVKQTYDRLMAAKAKKDQLVQQLNDLTIKRDSEEQVLVSIWGPEWRVGMSTDLEVVKSFEKRVAEATTNLAQAQG